MTVILIIELGHIQNDTFLIPILNEEYNVSGINFSQLEHIL